MPDLATFNETFAAAMTGDGADPSFASQPGFAIYRNTWLSAALDALVANYPRVEALLGTEAFAALALGYARVHRLGQPMLAHYGDRFAAFIEVQALNEELPYLADVARIDRLWTEAYFAADAEPLSPAAFSAIGLNEKPATMLRLHPASRHMWFNTPAAVIWLAHLEELSCDIEIAWEAGGVHVTRKDGAVVVDRISRPELDLLDLLASGTPVLQSAERIVVEHPDVDLAAIVARLLSRGALVHDLSSEAAG